MAHNLQKRLTLEYIYLLNVSISFYSVLWKKQVKLELSENTEKEHHNESYYEDEGHDEGNHEHEGHDH